MEIDRPRGQALRRRGRPASRKPRRLAECAKGIGTALQDGERQSFERTNERCKPFRCAEHSALSDTRGGKSTEQRLHRRVASVLYDAATPWVGCPPGKGCSLGLEVAQDVKHLLKCILACTRRVGPREHCLNSLKFLVHGELAEALVDGTAQRLPSAMKFSYCFVQRRTELTHAAHLRCVVGTIQLPCGVKRTPQLVDNARLASFGTVGLQAKAVEAEFGQAIVHDFERRHLGADEQHRLALTQSVGD